MQMQCKCNANAMQMQCNIESRDDFQGRFYRRGYCRLCWALSALHLATSQQVNNAGISLGISWLEANIQKHTLKVFNLIAEPI